MVNLRPQTIPDYSLSQGRAGRARDNYFALSSCQSQ